MAAKSFDVAKPGTTRPSSSSRPVIVTNYATVTDPVVKLDKDPDNTVGGAAKHKELKLQPLPTQHISAAEPAKEIESDTKIGVTSEAGEMGALADAASSKKKEGVDTEKIAQYQKLINDRTYFVKINESSKGNTGSKIIIVLFVLLLIGMITMNLLADANMIDIGVEPITNIL